MDFNIAPEPSPGTKILALIAVLLLVLAGVVMILSFAQGALGRTKNAEEIIGEMMDPHGPYIALFMSHSGTGAPAMALGEADSRAQCSMWREQAKVMGLTVACMPKNIRPRDWGSQPKVRG